MAVGSSVRKKMIHHNVLYRISTLYNNEHVHISYTQYILISFYLFFCRSVQIGVCEMRFRESATEGRREPAGKAAPEFESKPQDKSRFQLASMSHLVNHTRPLTSVAVVEMGVSD